jgi:metal-responsive CopG/Arc/MetJ family transcriptional regulator
MRIFDYKFLISVGQTDKCRESCSIRSEEVSEAIQEALWEARWYESGDL